MDNKEVLNESFFKKFRKPDFYEKLKGSMVQYAPVDAKSRHASFSSALAMDSNDTFSIKDSNEIKKRLSGTFGAAFGNNTVKSLASRSVKKFPIVVSDAVDPATVVMIKKLLEDQVAEYINLLISNQVIDLSSFDSASPEKGNIAIQALDQLSNATFSRQELANKAYQNRLSGEDVFATAPLLYSLIRHEGEIRTGNEVLDMLLENAVVIPAEERDSCVKYLSEMMLFEDEMQTSNLPTEEEKVGAVKIKDENKLHYSNMVMALEYSMLVDKGREPTTKDNSKIESRDYTPREIVDKLISFGIRATTANKFLQVDIYKNLATLIENEREKLAKKKNPTSFIDTNKPEPKFRDIIGKDEDTKNLTFADILTTKYVGKRNDGEVIYSNEVGAIADRYAKAMVLLQTFRISGAEFLDYCAIRLGIPIDRKTRAELVHKYPEGKVRNYSVRKADLINNFYLGSGDIKDILRSNTAIQDVNKKVLDKTVAQWIGYGALGAGVGGAVFAGSAALAGGPIGLLALIGALTGGGAVLLAKLLKKRKKINVDPEIVESYEGWERVEALIIHLDRQLSNTAEVRDYEKTRHDRKIGLEKAIKDYEKEISDAKNRYKLRYSFGGEKDRDTLVSGDDAKAAYEQSVKSLSDLNKQLATLNEEDEIASPEEVEKAIEAVKDAIEVISKNKSLKEEVVVEYRSEKINEAYTQQEALFKEALEEAYAEDKEFEADMLVEAVISLDSPTNVQFKKGSSKDMGLTVKKIKYDPSSELVVPNFTKSGAYAYGSVDYDRRENKERRFNAPLILTVNFRGKYSDGRTADNELTAVIGILGVVNRIPSEEMKYILKSNAEGTTLSGLLKGDGHSKNSFTDLLTGTKIKNDLKNLPQSGEMWRNLERVSEIAMANKLRGSNTDNVSNAHLVFAQKEIDELRGELGIDYIRDKKLSAQLLKRYSAFTLMVANDSGERVYIFDDLDNVSWNVVPYSALQSRGNDDQMLSTLSRLERGRIGG